MEINGKSYMQYAELIQSTEYSYDEKKNIFAQRVAISKLRTRKIKKYFKTHADLDLNLIEKSTMSTWEKVLKLAAFVAKNIPHDNQKQGLNKKNAITLWEYSKKVPTGFNCRWHAILLSELLLAVGIKNCFVTCLPKDNNDCDCHVVNMVWLSEIKRWAMIDADMTEYVVDADGTPLSLVEMRECICNNREFFIRPLPGFEDSWICSGDGSEYMKCYWAKNLYWFAKHTVYRYDLESKYCFGDVYICLVPVGYHYDKSKFLGLETTNDKSFWN